MKLTIDNVISFMMKYKLQQVMYHVLGMLAFATIYYIIHKYIDNAFQYNKDNGDLNILDFFYFSLVTQSTVGYGDITPIHKLPRIICMMQILLIYAITVISILN